MTSLVGDTDLTLTQRGSSFSDDIDFHTIGLDIYCALNIEKGAISVLAD